MPQYGNIITDPREQREFIRARRSSGQPIVAKLEVESVSEYRVPDREGFLGFLNRVKAGPYGECVGTIERMVHEFQRRTKRKLPTPHTVTVARKQGTKMVAMHYQSVTVSASNGGDIVAPVVGKESQPIMVGRNQMTLSDKTSGLFSALVSESKLEATR